MMKRGQLDREHLATEKVRKLLSSKLSMESCDIFATEMAKSR